jgi:hypothetical protein
LLKADLGQFPPEYPNPRELLSQMKTIRWLKAVPLPLHRLLDEYDIGLWQAFSIE